MAIGKLCSHELSVTRGNHAEVGQVPQSELIKGIPGWAVRVKILSNFEILGFSQEPDTVSGKLSQ